jgi:hypothetical protein
MPDQVPMGWVKTTLGEVCLPVETIQPADTPDIEYTYFDIGGIDNTSNPHFQYESRLPNLC